MEALWCHKVSQILVITAVANDWEPRWLEVAWTNDDWSSIRIFIQTIYLKQTIKKNTRKSLDKSCSFFTQSMI